MPKYVFGPVPSRRFGRSLGINNIPPKHCTYSCVYCQVGRTSFFEYHRRKFYDPDELVDEAVNIIIKNYNIIDYATFVPDGEPTLDINLGYEAEKIKNDTSVKEAIITNSSLICDNSVREDLKIFDAVSLKVDAVTYETWIKINRPHHRLKLDNILEEIIDFSKSYNGTLFTETMLVKDVNDNIEEIEKIASFLRKVKLNKAFISLPIRPPAEKWVKPSDEEKVLIAYNIFAKYLGKEHVELLISYESGDFYRVDDPISSLLSIVSVHPMRIDYVYKFLDENNIEHCILDKLIEEGIILNVKYGGYTFIVRKHPEIGRKKK
ncbi:MAG: radical SAM protein [Thermoproteales archaeon]|nr:radical SAM protein [Thermoproteales archaeon]